MLFRSQTAYTEYIPRRGLSVRNRPRGWRFEGRSEETGSPVDEAAAALVAGEVDGDGGGVLLGGEEAIGGGGEESAGRSRGEDAAELECDSNVILFKT